MPLDFRATDVKDLPAIQRLLQSAFHTGPDSPNLDSALFKWKYYDAGPDWEGSRSYALEKDGAMLAHGSLWPLKIGNVRAANLLDWAAVRFPPGMGVALVRKIAEISPVLISTGGSKATRAIMPRIGFRPAANQNIFVRVLRPWKQHRTRPAEPFARALPRLARNYAWSAPSTVPLRQWSAARADSLPDPAANHLLRCPSAVVSGWALKHPGGRAGYFVLSRVGGQCRVARIRTTDLAAGYALAVQAALEDAEACELVALSSTAAASRALEANNFRFRDQRPVSVHDPQHLIPASYPFDLDMLDDDMAYLNTPEYPYFT